MANISVITLVDKLLEYLHTIDNNQLSSLLNDWPLKPYKLRDIHPNSLPVISYLKAINHHSHQVNHILQLLQNYANNCFWGQTYSVDDFGENFLENYGWTEIIGLRGPIPSDTIACGFLLLGPNTEYPNHSHEAEEIYIPFSSDTLWLKGEKQWMPRESGIPIYHRPWVSHGMRTGVDPLLALYIWRGGDLCQKSHIE